MSHYTLYVFRYEQLLTSKVMKGYTMSSLKKHTVLFISLNLYFSYYHLFFLNNAPSDIFNLQLFYDNTHQICLELLLFHKAYHINWFYICSHTTCSPRSCLHLHQALLMVLLLALMKERSPLNHQHLKRARAITNATLITNKTSISYFETVRVLFENCYLELCWTVYSLINFQFWIILFDLKITFFNFFNNITWIFIIIKFSLRKLTIRSQYNKTSPPKISLRKAVFTIPPTWSTFPFPCTAILYKWVIVDLYLFHKSCLPWKWAADLYWEEQLSVSITIVVSAVIYSTSRSISSIAVYNKLLVMFQILDKYGWYDFPPSTFNILE